MLCRVSFSSFNNSESAPLLADVSRSLDGLIGLWMLYRAFTQPPHVHGSIRDHGQELAVGSMAGLIPCPGTLFVMTPAVSRGVPEAGIAFTLAIMLGGVLTLSPVAAATTLLRHSMVHLIENRAALLVTRLGFVSDRGGLLLTLIANCS